MLEQVWPVGKISQLWKHLHATHTEPLPLLVLGSRTQSSTEDTAATGTHMKSRVIRDPFVSGPQMIPGTKPNDLRKTGTVLEPKCMSIAHLDMWQCPRMTRDVNEFT